MKGTTMTTNIYSVSIMTTRNDNGFCVSFTSREKAEQCRRECLADGCYHVSQIVVN
jgi:hypothetical protein